MAIQGLQASQHHLVRQNAIFALGCLARAAKNNLQPALETIMQFVSPCLQMPRGAANVKDRTLRDNAFSTLGNILSNVDIPNDQFQMLFGVFINGLPLEADMQENEHVARSILRICQMKSNLIQNFLPQVQQVLSSTPQWEKMPQELLQEISTLFSS